MTKQPPGNIKAILFDMDGVLYDSMPNHAISWQDAFKKYNIDFSRKEAYLHEGRPGHQTIKIIIYNHQKRTADHSETDIIYNEKVQLMNKLPAPPMISGMKDLMDCIRKADIKILVVTGSRQPSLIKRLNHDYNISANEIVSAKDVEKGKPHPEPYLTALRKAGCKADEAIVIENAPLGVESANNANIYTIVINTGPLDPQTLLDAGGAIVVEESKEIKDFLKNQYPGGCV